MEGLWRTQDMARSEPFQHVPGVLIVILSFPDIWAGKCCPMVLFTCVSSISSPPTLFSAHSNLVSSLPLYLWPQNATKSNGWLSVPILLGSPPQSSVHSLPWLLSLCIPPAYPAAPFWLLFDFLFFQCPLNDNQSLSLSLSLIYLLSIYLSTSQHTPSFSTREKRRDWDALNLGYIVSGLVTMLQPFKYTSSSSKSCT